MFAAMSSGYIEKRTLSGGRTAYRARVRTPGGKIVSRQFGSRREARDWIDGFEDGVQPAPQPARRDLTLLEFYVDNRDLILHGLKDQTRSWYEQILRVHVLPSFGRVRLTALGPADLERWVKLELSTKLKPASVKGCWVALSKILKAAVRLGHLGSNPMAGMPTPRVPDNKAAMEFIPKDVLLLSMTVESRYRPLILMLAYGGLRYSEGVGLRHGSFSPGFDSVTIESAMDRHYEFSAPKSSAGIRTVPLPALLSSALAEHCDAHGIIERNQLMFTRPDGMPVEYSWFRRNVWTPALEQAGLRMTPHQLRHFAVSMWIKSGASVLQVKTWAGHSSASFTLDRYGHLFPADASTITARMNQHLA